ncbi:GntR family transcriptional regulator, partial [Zavarzinella formosa]|uniref:GntR family transcriptional regulator n=1 Tax=Zavarzinella formosa TaxID=360055 RepID=UPI00138B14D6
MTRTVAFPDDPTTTPKYLQVSHQIEGDIVRGKWPGGRLPGVRSLARDYGISIVTASRSLQDLVDRGLVETRERFGCFIRSNTPAPAPAATVETWGLCLRLTPGPWRQGTEASFRDGFAAAAAMEGCQVRNDLFPNADAAESVLTGQARAAREAGV